jgi:hypothetical protein
MPDVHVFAQPWPAGPTDQRRDQVIYYQYKTDRARRTLLGIDEQIAKAEKVAAGRVPVKPTGSSPCPARPRVWRGVHEAGLPPLIVPALPIALHRLAPARPDFPNQRGRRAMRFVAGVKKPAAAEPHPFHAGRIEQLLDSPDRPATTKPRRCSRYFPVDSR